MEIGKLPNDVLEKIVISNIKNKRQEVLVRAGIGEDSAVIDYYRSNKGYRFFSNSHIM